MTPRVVFCGTPTFAVPSLDALVDVGAAPCAVFTQPDRPAGRGRKPVSSPVRERAAEHRLAVFQPQRLSTEIEHLQSLAPDVIIVVAYGLILPCEVLQIPPLGCVNVHASLLPRWRGPAPIARAIEAGDRRTGITLMRMDQGVDTGDILVQVAEPIMETDTAATLHDRLAVLGGRVLRDALPALFAGTLVGRPQEPRAATYAAKLAKSEATIDWQSDAATLARRVHAFHPWPVAQTTHKGEVLRIWDACPTRSNAEALPGTVLEARGEHFIVQTGDGALRLLSVQRSGGRPQPAAPFLRGADVEAGDVLGLPLDESR